MNFGGMTRTHVITGSFGSGKTTAIRWMMANKPENELWMVILNEFTDADLDALSVAEVAPTAEFLEVWRSLLREVANPVPGASGAL